MREGEGEKEKPIEVTAFWVYIDPVQLDFVDFSLNTIEICSISSTLKPFHIVLVQW